MNFYVNHFLFQSKKIMIRYIKKWGQLMLLAGLSTACYVDPTTITPTTPASIPSAGNANFAKYIAIGNSLTAGYADGGVYRAGQLVAYPNILAQQFRTVGGGNFLQPLYSEDQKDGTGYLVLRALVPSPNIQTFGPTSLGFKGGIRSASPLLYTKYTGDNNNFGVPCIMAVHAGLSTYGAANGGNPHFERLLSDADAGTKSYIQYVTEKGAGMTFFSLWLGNNDALGYAISGGTGTITGVNGLTPLAAFTASYTSMVNALKAINPNAKGVLITIPNVTLIPHFSAITYNSLLAQIQAVNPNITAIFIETSSGTRAATANDRFILGAQADYGNLGSTTVGAGVPFPYGLHPSNPLKSSSVLDVDEVTAINTRIGEFNTFITNTANTEGYALFDANTLLATASSTAGYKEVAAPPITSSPSPFTYRTTFVSGGVFSLDGIHMTPAGNAITANEIIRAINAKYGSTIRTVDLRAYRSVQITPAQ
jgi:lysophospholipase L1-like esterase